MLPTSVSRPVGQVLCSCGWKYFGLDVVTEFGQHARECRDGAVVWTARQWLVYEPVAPPPALDTTSPPVVV